MSVCNYNNYSLRNKSNKLVKLAVNYYRLHNIITIFKIILKLQTCCYDCNSRMSFETPNYPGSCQIINSKLMSNPHTKNGPQVSKNK